MHATMLHAVYLPFHQIDTAAGTPGPIHDQAEYGMRASRWAGECLSVLAAVRFQNCRQDNRAARPEHPTESEGGLSGLQIDQRVFPSLNNWNRNYTMETILTDLRREMISPHNRKLPQPQEGTMY